jgi:hypothetical protein
MIQQVVSQSKAKPCTTHSRFFDLGKKQAVAEAEDLFDSVALPWKPRQRRCA